MGKIKICFALLMIGMLSNAANRDTLQQVYYPGEQLTYLAHFGFLNAGKATFKLQDRFWDGKQTMHAVAEAKTMGVADKIYKVRDVYESYMNPDNGLHYLAIRNINEGNYKYYNEVKYHQDSNLVYSQKSGTQQVPSRVMDMVAAFYQLRNHLPKGMKPGETIFINTYFADEIFPLEIRFMGYDMIRTRLGKFRSMKFSPVVEPGRIFDTEDDVTIWFSADKNYVPLQVRIDLIIGSIKCDLVDYAGLQYPLEQIDK